MKYDVLEGLKGYLEKEYGKNTAKKYYAAAVKLFRDDYDLTVNEINEEVIKERLDHIRGKNEFSAAKQAVLGLKKVYPDITIPGEDWFLEQSLHRKNRSKKKTKTIDLDATQRKINQIADQKLKYAFRLAIDSGLRVSELAEVLPEDITFKEGDIYVNVTHGKGGSNGVVKCQKDPYLYEHLQDFIKKQKEEYPEENNKKLFYASNTMQKKAHDLGIECHDLRRICAITLRNELKKEMPVEEANAQVKEQLRHARFSTTKRYLFNRKLRVKEKKIGGKG
ncbi:MAG: tyrosine-type recombinase/integrase [Lachnospiraceae bacterium]